MLAGGGIDARVPQLAEAALFVTAVPVRKLQGTGNGLFAALDGCAVTLLETFGSFADFLMLLMGCDAAFDSHNLYTQFLLQSLGLGAGERTRSVQAALAPAAFFLQEVIQAGMTMYELTGLGNSDALFSTAMSL